LQFKQCAFRAAWPVFLSQVAGFFLLKVRLQPAKAGFETFKNIIFVDKDSNNGV
jgi:hypothetical protein